MQARGEIKFRAWYETGKRMIDWDEMKGDDELPYILENKLSDVSPAMQFTGLYDKNGKEIYEGDWLKDTESFDEVYFYCVVWSKSNCCFYFKDVFGTEHFGGEDLYLNQVEVIGNVFENPELLEVSE